MYFINPKDTERFYLRVLLNTICGIKSFDDLKILNGVEYDSYKDVAFQLGLVDDDDECDACLEEAATYNMPSQLRHLFAFLLVYCQPANVKDLWEKFLDHLIEDFISQENSRDLAIAKALLLIEKYLIQNGMTLLDFPNLPIIDYALLEEDQQNNTLIAKEQHFDQNKINETSENEKSLNEDQNKIFVEIIKAIKDEINSTLFFVDGPGGTGKTFLYNLLLAYIRSKKHLNGIAIAVASSGIAALLMSGGRTAHSRFKIPLKVDHDSTLNIDKQSELAKLIQNAIAILWDEAPIVNRFAFEAVNRTFRDLMNTDLPFGEKIMIFLVVILDRFYL